VDGVNTTFRTHKIERFSTKNMATYQTDTGFATGAGVDAAGTRRRLATGVPGSTVDPGHRPLEVDDKKKGPKPVCYDNLPNDIEKI
jgi:hypothetical protein